MYITSSPKTQFSFCRFKVPFATPHHNSVKCYSGNKLNCFISTRGMLAIVWHCVLLVFFVCVFC